MTELNCTVFESIPDCFLDCPAGRLTESNRTSSGAQYESCVRIHRRSKKFHDIVKEAAAQQACGKPIEIWFQML